MSRSLETQLWYLARGTGVVDLVLLTVVVALGIASRSGQPAFGLPRFAVQAVHRNAALGAVLLLVVHVTSLMLDPYAQLRLVDVVAPFLGVYRPLWLGLGTLASDLLLVLVVTSLLRHRLSARTWRTIHWAAYAMWPLALLHGLFNGTDRTRPWALTTYALCTVLMVAAVAWRAGERFPRSGRAETDTDPQPRRVAPPALDALR